MMFLNQPVPYLKLGDLIRIIAPAKAIEAEFVAFAQEFLEKNGFRVLVGAHTLGRWNYLSGTDAERMSDMQEALDDPECKAILCARGGYGSVRILEKLNWAGFLREPKWLVGFSDITFFHNHIQSCDLPSIHGVYYLMNGETGQPLATMDGARLTVWRTAAASALARAGMYEEAKALMIK